MISALEITELHSGFVPNCYLVLVLVLYIPPVLGEPWINHVVGGWGLSLLLITPPLTGGFLRVKSLEEPYYLP